MNNIFSFHRFSLLLRKYWNENAKQGAFSIVALTGILTMAFSYVIFMTRNGPDEGVQHAFFDGFLHLAGGIYTCSIFSQYAGNQKAAAALTLPASQLEKYLLAFLLTVVGFPIVYLGVYYFVDFAVLYLTLGKDFRTGYLVNSFHIQTFFNYFLVQSFALIGAIYFKKFHFVKTAAAFFIFLVMLFWFNTVLGRWLIHEHQIIMSPPFRGIRFIGKDHQFYVLDLPNEISLLYYRLALSGLTLCFWWSSYLKLKEKQI